jgi:hypothetical protein
VQHFLDGMSKVPSKKKEEFKQANDYKKCIRQLEKELYPKEKALVWTYSIELKQGSASTYDWFLANQDSFRG